MLLLELKKIAPQHYEVTQQRWARNDDHSKEVIVDSGTLRSFRIRCADFPELQVPSSYEIKLYLRGRQMMRDSNPVQIPDSMLDIVLTGIRLSLNAKFNSTEMGIEQIDNYYRFHS